MLDAPWVSETEARAGVEFGQWLDRRLADDCDTVKRNGYRKGNCRRAGLDKVSPQNPELPAPRVLNAIQYAWGPLRRAAFILRFLRSLGFS